MKNICVLIRSLAHGGAEKQSLMLTKALKDQYVTHLVILDEQPQHTKHLKYIEDEGLPCRFLSGSFFQKLKAFRAFLKENRIDVLFTYLPSDTFFGALAARLEKIPHVFGGIRNASMEKWKRVILQWVHHHWLNYSISNSYVGKENFTDYGFDPNQILVMPNGLELETDLIERPEKKTLNVLSVGRFVEQKDYETAIKAFHHLKNHFPLAAHAKLQIIGFGRLEGQIQRWIKAYGLEQSTELIVSPRNLGQYYASADIYLCTSLVEGLSNSVMEAMSYSLPIIATDAGDNNKLVKTGENGFICPIKDYQTLAASIHNLIESYSLRIRFGQKSYQIIQDNYTFEAFQNNYIRLIQSL